MKGITATNVCVADLSDEQIEQIAALRKSIKDEKEREGYVRGLYYISSVDNDYARAEQEIVEGTACALGINQETLATIVDDINNSKLPIPTFAKIGGKKYQEGLLREMASLCYAKGFLLQSEDDALCGTAAVMGLSTSKRDKIIDDACASVCSEGIQVHAKSTAAKVALGVGAVAVGATLCALTAGAAAPAIGAAIAPAGLSGAAASSAGLAILGGGSVAMGGGGVAAGTALVTAAGAVIGGGGAFTAVSVKENIANAYDIKKLRETIKKQQKDHMTKQQIIQNLIEAINMQKERLEALEAAQASQRDINAITTQIANLQLQKLELESA